MPRDRRELKPTIDRKDYSEPYMGFGKDDLYHAHHVLRGELIELLVADDKHEFAPDEMSYILDPYMATALHFNDNLPFYPDAPNVDDISNSEWIEMIIRGDSNMVAGRIRTETTKIYTGTEQACLTSLVDEVSEYTRTPIKELDPTLITPKDYRRLVRYCSEALRDVIRGNVYGTSAEIDAGAVASSASLVFIAEVSGDPKVYNLALSELNNMAVMLDNHRFYHDTLLPEYKKLIDLKAEHKDEIISAEDIENEPSLRGKDIPTLLRRTSLGVSLINGRKILQNGPLDDRVAIARRKFEIARDMEVLDELFPSAPEGTYRVIESESAPDIEGLESISITEELDWTVLPEGDAALVEAAKEIVQVAQDRASKVAGEGKKAIIDIKRLQILTSLREVWETDDRHTAFYARGKLSGRVYRDAEGGSRADEYIVLVLSKEDEDGSVLHEHAIAESPIAGHNAMYVLRGDIKHGVEDLNWRSIYSKPKIQARLMGARAVKHIAPQGLGLVDVMSERGLELLTCDADEFHSSRFKGTKLVRICGKLAIE